ncbi:PfaD family polyunsaturated fatty acid/polyketide biosynthesis protein [Paenibacillus jiagnxiensis]|uniref:PfaD family polyunsaturated fatty acid/polyketide biosynthesis protein n=1 Tax=Paenibacillus jiagnxiensis TaxID=3228926 RepID=UPI0033A08718
MKQQSAGNWNAEGVIGGWQSAGESPLFDPEDIKSTVSRIREPIHIVGGGPNGSRGVAFGGSIHHSSHVGQEGIYPLIASLPAIYPEWLGDRSFLQTHGLRFPYVVGEMANGLATTAMVIAAAKAGMLGFFGSAGLSPQRVAQAIDELKAGLEPLGLPWGVNLIHSPSETDTEETNVDLYLKLGVTRMSASAFMSLTPSIVRYACSGLRLNENGHIVRLNHVFAKISRPEIAKLFMSPAPEHILLSLVRSGKLTAEEARLASRIPVSEDITVEADSGGHTDNRPLGTLFSTIAALRDELMAFYGYDRSIRVGAAGGIGTPAAAAAAFALGAAYIVTGSINQASLESGLSDAGKQMLAKADLADVTMAPSADMFEMGVKVQVLKRGTMFSGRAHRLFEVYRQFESLESIPLDQRAKLEKEIFQDSLEQIWDETERFFQNRDPQQLVRAQKDAKHRMALVFRWYLGHASRWAIQGTAERRLDYQIWCGPAIGAFNAWAAGSFLEDPANRGVVPIALNMMEGAAVITRAHQLRTYGIAVVPGAFNFYPRPMSV